jgi:hypothetical protein
VQRYHFGSYEEGVLSVARQLQGETSGGFEIGSLLREVRERKQLTFDDVERAICIRGRYLEALENERFELLPGDAYARAFLRAYARFLGLDGDRVAAEYAARFPNEDESAPAPPVVSRKRRRLTGRAVILVGVLGVVLASVLLAWRPGEGGGGKPVAEPAPPAPPARVVRHRPKPKPPPPAPRPAPPARLFLTAARGDCWLLVRRGSEAGPVVWQGMLRRGQTRSFVVRPLWIRVGAPSNLAARMGARRVTLPLAHTGNLLVRAATMRAV